MITCSSVNSNRPPPYCPNRHCFYNQINEEVFYIKNGFTRTLKRPFINQRYRCLECGKQFSDNTFKLDYRKRFIGLSQKVIDLKSKGLTISSLAEHLHLSEPSTRGRIRDLARQLQIFESSLGAKIDLNEGIVYDGFESKTGTNFSPHYINTAVGTKSFFTYATTYSPLNRKGQMTKWQKLKNKSLQDKFGKYPSDSVRSQTTYILKKLLGYSDQDLDFYTDEHRAYWASVNIDLKDEAINHYTTNSKEARTASNPLFPVNHLHMLKRHFNSAHRRKGIAFHKNEAGVMDAVIINRISKNFMRPKFSRPNRADPKAHKESPAMKIGLADRILTLDDILPFRKQVSHAQFDEEELKVYRRDWSFSRFPTKAYLGN